jgi:hypothetical protein
VNGLGRACAPCRVPLLAGCGSRPFRTLSSTQPDPTSPPRHPGPRRAPSREGRAFSREIRLRQIRRRTPQHLDLLLQPPVALLRLADPRGLRSRPAGLRALVCVGAAEPPLLPGCRPVLARSDVTYPCSRPHLASGEPVRCRSG